MKKRIIIIILLFILVGFICYLLFYNKKEVKYYTYEGSFVMSSFANKVNNYKKLKNEFFIKEEIKRKKSKNEIIEVLYSGVKFDEYQTYGYYDISLFNKYFSNYIDDGLKCDGESKYYLEEGNSFKCITHESGYSYKDINSQLCVIINDKLICIKPNDWDNNELYKKEFEEAGWKCVYHDYLKGVVSSIAPSSGTLECSKTDPSIRDTEELFCYISTDGSSTCSNNNSWCSISNDLNTYCFGID